MALSLPNIRPYFRSVFDGTQSSDPRLSLTQPMACYRRSRNGRYTQVPPHTPRIEFDYSTRKCLGLLVEETSSNLVPHTRDFTDWVKYDVVVSETSELGPDGLTTAHKLTPGTTKEWHRLDRNFAQPASAYATCSVFLKSAGLRYAGLEIGNYTGQNLQGQRIGIDLLTGELVGVVDKLRVSVERYADGWWRLRTTTQMRTTSASFGTFRIEPSISHDTSLRNFEGNGVDGILIWGPQYEAKSVMTSFIPTSGTQVSRIADIALYDIGTDLHQISEDLGLYIDSVMYGRRSTSGFQLTYVDPESWRWKYIGTGYSRITGPSNATYSHLSETEYTQASVMEGDWEDAVVRSKTLGVIRAAEILNVYNGDIIARATPSNGGVKRPVAPRYISIGCLGDTKNRSFTNTLHVRNLALYRGFITDEQVMQLTSL